MVSRQDVVSRVYGESEVLLSFQRAKRSVQDVG